MVGLHAVNKPATTMGRERSNRSGADRTTRDTGNRSRQLRACDLYATFALSAQPTFSLGHPVRSLQSNVA